MNVTETLARFVLDASYESFSKETIHQGKRCFIDLIGVILGGCKQPLSEILLETIKEFGGKPQATILGYGLKTDLINAAMINGSIAHALDYDDIHRESMGHPSAPLIPAILAVGEWKRISGKVALESFILGFEVETRIGMGMGADHYERGWHSTATFGRFGAAVATGKILGLSLNKMLHAMGLAGTQASGLRLVFGTMAKSLHSGKSASDGILSALLAAKGFTCAPNIIEGKKGYAEVLGGGGGGPNIELMVKDLGEQYEILNNTFKPYASCSLTHPTIDALIELRKRHKFRIEDIDQIQCEVSKSCLDVAGVEDPQTGLAAKFSTYHCAALALAKGVVSEDMFKDERIIDPVVRSTRQKVKIKVSPETKGSEARVTITTVEGNEYTTYVDRPKGDPRNPLSDIELESKFESLAGLILPEERYKSLLKMLWSLEEVKDIGHVLELCSPRPQTSAKEGS